MKRLAILNAVKAKLEKITVANGFNTDIGNHSDYWHDLDFEYGETGAVSFEDASEEMKQINIPYENTLCLKIKSLKFSLDTLTDGCYLLEDLIKATKDENWGGLALKTALKSNEKTIETKGQTVVKVALTLTISYRE